jgi:hypothetical protein
MGWNKFTVHYSPFVLADRIEQMHKLDILILGCTKYSIIGFYNVNICIMCRSRDSSVGIATVYGLDEGGVGVRVTVGARPALWFTQPFIQWVPGLFPRV